MKKIFLSLAAAAVGLSAMATPFSVANRVKLHPENCPDLISHEISSFTKGEAVVGSRAGDYSDGIYYSPAGEPAQALSLNNQTGGTQAAMAFQIDPAFLASVTDGQITEISYYTGTVRNQGINNITKATVFIADDLASTNILYQQEITAPKTQFTKVDAVLDTPFDIPAGKKIYVGVYFTIKSPDDIPFVVDYQGHLNNYGGWLAVRSNSLAKWSWDNIASDFGFFTLGAKIKATSMPENSVSIVAIDGQPVAAENQPFGFSFLLQNNGVNSFRTLTVEYGIDGEETVTEDFELDGECPINQNIIASIDGIFGTKPAKSTNVTVNIKAIDGEPNTSEQAIASYPVTIVPADNALPRNVVIEEFTSINCVACPVGYTAMEMIHEEYTDGSVIPVCIHVNFSGRDPMTATTYNTIYNKYSDGSIPSSTINRTYSVYPYYEDLVETAEQIKMLPGVAAVAATAALDKENRILTVNTESVFAFDYEDGDKNFILAYGITENNVGPYTQQNGYAGYQGSVPGGWENQPTTVQLVYNDVARQLDKTSGITGSVPAEIKAGEIYEYSHDVKLNSSVSDFDNSNLVVYLLNKKTGAIENSCTITGIGQYDTAGIESVVTDNSDAPVEYFNLQGVRISEPNGGVFIRRQGSNVTKVLVK